MVDGPEVQESKVNVQALLGGVSDKLTVLGAISGKDFYLPTVVEFRISREVILTSILTYRVLLTRREVEGNYERIEIDKVNCILNIEEGEERRSLCVFDVKSGVADFGRESLELVSYLWYQIHRLRLDSAGNIEALLLEMGRRLLKPFLESLFKRIMEKKSLLQLLEALAGQGKLDNDEIKGYLKCLFINEGLDFPQDIVNQLEVLGQLEERGILCRPKHLDFLRRIFVASYSDPRNSVDQLLKILEFAELS